MSVYLTYSWVGPIISVKISFIYSAKWGKGVALTASEFSPKGFCVWPPTPSFLFCALCLHPHALHLMLAELSVRTR